MDTDNDILLSQTFAKREALVDNKKTEKQSISRTSVRRGIDWTLTLKSIGLESPGYRETIEKMYKQGKINRKK
jgi:hypothetical protein